MSVGRTWWGPNPFVMGETPPECPSPRPSDSVLGSRRKEEENEQGDQGGGRGHGGGGEGLVRVGPNEKWAGTYGMPDAGTDRLRRAGG